MKEEEHQIQAVVVVRPVCISGGGEGLETEYRVRMNPGVRPEHYANTALDVFHSNVPLTTLDNFRFEVLLDGEPIQEDEEVEPYTMEGKGELL